MTFRPTFTSSEDLDPATEGIRLRLAVARLQRRIRMIDGHPPLQLAALSTIAAHGPLRPSELARREAVSSATMSRVLCAFEGEGLVVRVDDPRHGRGALVTLSDAGRQRLDAVLTHRAALLARRLERLDPEQRASIRAALPALEAMLENE